MSLIWDEEIKYSYLLLNVQIFSRCIDHLNERNKPNEAGCYELSISQSLLRKGQSIRSNKRNYKEKL